MAIGHLFQHPAREDTELDRETYKRVLSKIVKGLYFIETRQLLPSDVQMLCDYGADHPEPFIAAPLYEAVKKAKRVDYGGVVNCWRIRMKDDPTASITWLRFYEDKIFMVVTFREEALALNSSR